MFGSVSPTAEKALNAEAEQVLRFLGS
jgi:hypothetical protein